MAAISHSLPGAARATDVPSVRREATLVVVTEITLIFAIFYLHAGWPVPDPNEPYYLGKAKHFWNPDWAAGDDFFQTAHTHQVFYFTLGWLTRWLPLAWFAWGGRLVTWALLAWSWCRLSTAVAPGRGWTVLSAALLVCFQERFQMAGEWFLGGFEAKGFAYVLVFLGLESVARNRWRRAWLLLGAAGSAHVLVGGWSAIAAGGAWLMSRGERPTLLSMAPAMLGGLLLALPGLVPAAALTWGVDPQVVSAANVIYVFERLPHHLNPLAFPEHLVASQALLFLAWLLFHSVMPADGAHRRLRRFVLAAVGVAVLGWIIAIVLQQQPAIAARFLRYYWFRLADVALPLGAALAVVGYLRDAFRARPEWARAWCLVAVIVAAAHVVDYGISTQTAPRPRADKSGKVADYEDWLDVCRWVKEHTPTDARFLTPVNSQTFKWYAERGEVVIWKDIPQEARAIVAWRRKLDDIFDPHDPERRWYDSLAERGEDALRRLAAEYKADYLLTAAEPPLDPPPLYQNNSYAVYRLTD